jgi:hypothetical protein
VVVGVGQVEGAAKDAVEGALGDEITMLVATAPFHALGKLAAIAR